MRDPSSITPILILPWKLNPPQPHPHTHSHYTLPTRIAPTTTKPQARHTPCPATPDVQRQQIPPRNKTRKPHQLPSLALSKRTANSLANSAGPDRAGRKPRGRGEMEGRVRGTGRSERKSRARWRFTRMGGCYQNESRGSPRFLSWPPFFFFWLRPPVWWGRRVLPAHSVAQNSPFWLRKFWNNFLSVVVLWYEGQDLWTTLLYLPWEKNYEKTSLSPLNTKKYNVYFKRYVQAFVKEIVRLYTSMKEFGLTKGV